jgi:hypothetical protein
MQTQNEILRKKYFNPVWVNFDKTTLEVREKTKIGKIKKEQCLVVTKWDDEDETKINPLFETITNIYSIEEIDNFTEKFNDEVKENIKKESAQREEEEEVKRLRELFNVKLDIFNISSINESSDKEMKSLIRKSKSNIEAIAFAVILMMKEMKNKDEDN